MQNFGFWHLSKMKVTTFSARGEEAGKKERKKNTKKQHNLIVNSPSYTINATRILQRLHSTAENLSCNTCKNTAQNVRTALAMIWA